MAKDWLNRNTCVVFDLDDTLFSERDFVFSAYRSISSALSQEGSEDLYQVMCDLFDRKESTFDVLRSSYNVSWSIQQLVSHYREHLPIIRLRPGALAFLQICKAEASGLGLITDGRSSTQRAKIAALGIEEYFDFISISEEIQANKPSEKAFLLTMERIPSSQYIYIADNYAKDFVAPKKLGWTCIGFKNDGFNIHPQHYTKTEQTLPDYEVPDFQTLIEADDLAPFK